jgi:hypothetical protein
MSLHRPQPHSLRRAAAVAATTAFAAMLAACGGNDDVEPPLPEASATIGAAGGTLSLPDGAALVVPPGALASDVQLRIVKSRANAPELPEGTADDLPVYEITPHGTRFQVPVTVRLPLQSSSPPDTTAFIAPDATEGWGTTAARVVGNAIEVDRLALSWYSYFNSNVNCAIPRNSTDPYPCQPPFFSATGLAATPAAALDTQGINVSQAARIRSTLNFSAAPDCGNGRLLVRRSTRPDSGPATGPAVVIDRAVTLARSATTGRVGASELLEFDVSHLDNGSLSYEASFSCNRAYQGRRQGASGLLTLRVNAPVPAAAPVITRQPAAQVVAVGQQAGFSLDFTAAPNELLSQRWLRSNDGGTTWIDLGPGIVTSTGAGLVFTAALADNGSRFKANVCAGSGARQTCIDSAVVTLGVTAPVDTAPSFTQQPTDLVWNRQTTTYTFTAAASGRPAPTYQWRAGGQDLPAQGRYTNGACQFDHSANGGQLQLTGVANACVGTVFSVVASNSVGSAASHNAQLTGTLAGAYLLAGQPGQPGFVDGAAAPARFRTPNYVTVNAQGLVAVGDFSNHAVRLFDGTNVVTLAGNGQPGSADGTGAQARFNGNGGVVFDPAGNLFVADWDNHTIRRITPAGVVTTFVGQAGQAGSIDGTGNAARLRNPNGLAIDASGNLYLADWGNHTIRRITPAGVVTTLAGQAGAAGSADGVGAAARFNLPGAVAIDGNGYLYVSDINNHTVRRVRIADGTVETWAGTAGQPGTADGNGAAARFNQPAWISATTDGTVFLVPAAGDTVRRISPTRAVTTVVGVAGDSAAVVLGANPRLRNARGLWVDATGTELRLAADQALLRIVLP